MSAEIWLILFSIICPAQRRNAANIRVNFESPKYIVYAEIISSLGESERIEARVHYQRPQL
jgi:hypothetical protein